MILDRFSLTGKVAIVTGCRSGIGQAVAVGLAQAGADIVGVGSTSFEETQRLVGEAGRRFAGVRADLTCVDAIPAVLDAALAAFGRVDILVNNAGMTRRADAIDFTLEDWDAVMDLNLRTVFFLCQAVARQFLAQATGGKIINIASLLSFQGGIRCASYAASKSGVAGITRALCNEWAARDINVNAIAPGYIRTDITSAIRDDEARNAEILARVPAGRWGAPEDIAGMAVYLASPASDFVHGAVLAVDGGWLAR